MEKSRLPHPTDPTSNASSVEPTRFRSAIELGAAGIVGGVIGGAAGIWSISSLVGPTDVDPWNFVGLTIAAIGVLLAIGAGAVLGFMTGVIVAVTVVATLRNLPDLGRTLAWLVALEFAVVPITIWLMVLVGNRWEAAGDPAVWVGAIVAGGPTPAFARLLATRSDNREV